MAVFKHPHLTRGIVTTARGAFVVSRGFVSAPDEIGESLGWRRVDTDSLAAPDAAAAVGRPGSIDPREAAPPDRL